MGVEVGVGLGSSLPGGWQGSLSIPAWWGSMGLASFPGDGLLTLGVFFYVL